MMLARLFGTKATLTALEHDLLDSIRESAIPNPNVLRERLATLNRQIDAAEAEWENLDRRGDAGSFLHLQPIAERLHALRAEAASLPAALAAAQQRRDAFLALNRLFDATAADVSARMAILLERPPADAREHDVQLEVLDQATRLLGHLATRLNIVSNAPQFRRVDDALKLLREEYERRIHACDLLRAPGMRRKLVLPETMSALLDVMENRERKTA